MARAGDVLENLATGDLRPLFRWNRAWVIVGAQEGLESYAEH